MPNVDISDAKITGGLGNQSQRTLGARLDQSAWVYAADWGVVADGSTDNATALMNMRTDLAGTGKPHWNIVFPAGTIKYSNNRWLYNIQSCTLWCYGVTFQNTLSGGVSATSRPLFTGDMYQTNTIAFTSTYTWTSEYYLFNDAVAGATSLTTTTASDAGNIAAGDRLFLGFFSGQMVNTGHPPSYRYFEWNEAAAAGNSGTGEVTLKSPLRHEYYNAVFDSSTDPDRGKPRLLVLDRSEYSYPRLLDIRGAAWAINPNDSSGGHNAFVVAADRVKLIDCTIPSQWSPSQCRLYEVENCRFTGTGHSVDKSVDILHVKDSVFLGELDEATAVYSALFERCRFGGQVEMSPRRLKFVDCDFNHLDAENFGPIGNNGGWPIEGIEVIGCRVRGTDANEPLVNMASTPSVVADSVSSGVISLTDDDAAKNAVRDMAPGTLIYKSDLSVYGEVRRIEFSTTHDITVNWAGGTAPSNGDTLYFHHVGWLRVSDLRCDQPFSLTSTYLGHMLRAPGNNGEVIVDRWPWTGGTVTFSLNAFIDEIDIIIGSAYSGSDSAPAATFRLSSDGGSTYTTYATLALKTVQRCVLRPNYADTTSSDTVAALPDAVSKWTHLQVLLRQGGGSMSGTEGQMPMMTMRVRGRPLIPATRTI